MISLKIEERMEELWGEFSPQPTSLSCSYARHFAAWAQQLCADTETRARQPEPAGIIAINQAYVLLLNQYFHYRYVVPKRHRNCVRSTDHICIFAVFESTFQRLKALELALNPPVLYEPEPPPPPPPPPRLAA